MYLSTQAKWLIVSCYIAVTVFAHFAHTLVHNHHQCEHKSVTLEEADTTQGGDHNHAHCVAHAKTSKTKTTGSNTLSCCETSNHTIGDAKSDPSVKGPTLSHKHKHDCPLCEHLFSSTAVELNVAPATQSYTHSESVLLTTELNVHAAENRYYSARAPPAI